MLARVKTSTIFGTEAVPVEVEVRVKRGTSHFTIIGLGDGAVKEARDRVTAAIKSSGFMLPEQILINLAPAELKKEGSAFDLAIAVAVLAGSGQVMNELMPSMKFHGELALDGRVKPVRGIIAHAIEALESGAQELVVPSENVSEAALISGLDIIGVSSLLELIDYLRDGVLPEHNPKPYATVQCVATNAFDDVCGQDFAKRALTIAAVGGHNLLMIGPPGCGKSMLAGRFPALLPPLSKPEALEVAKVYSISGLSVMKALAGERPYRSPHHVVTEVGLVGGGSCPRPGEISLAHNGVLFLDEFPEYRRAALEALRAPLENGVVQVTRAKGRACFPADFQLVAAMNPCPCGRLGMKGAQCLCSRSVIQSYLRKLSQPILDRIDLHVELEAVPITALTTKANKRVSEQNLSTQVQEARKRQMERCGQLNCRLDVEQLTVNNIIKQEALQLLEKASTQAGLSARGYVKVLRIARSIADLEGEERISSAHAAEALGFRCLERIEKYCRG